LGAEEPLALGGLGGLDAFEHHAGVDVLFGDERAQLRQQLVVVGAALDVQDLDGHARYQPPGPDAGAAAPPRRPEVAFRSS
jgi:hypothetical protein